MTDMKLPEPLYPRIMLMVTDSLVPAAEGAKEEPMSWAVSVAHPFIPNAQIVALFGSGGGIDVYSVRRDEKTGEVEGMRDHVPMSRVRVFREAMPFDIFAKELAAAELEEDEDDDADADQEDGDTASMTQATPSTAVSLPVTQPDGSSPDRQTQPQSDGQPSS